MSFDRGARKGYSAGRQRAHGTIAISVERMGKASRVRRAAESGSARVRFPTARDGVPEAVLINTAGGVAGGDRFEAEILLGPDAALVATTASAEKVYRSAGDTSLIGTRAMLGPRSRLDWMPQETILFAAARLQRSLEVEMAGSASALLCEGVVFGRAASGESLTSCLYEDRWRVRRDGCLIYADTFRLSENVSTRLAAKTGLAGSRALATMLYVAPDAEARLDQARAAQEGAASECGAGAWHGMLLARFLAPDVETLRRDAARFITLFRGRPMPRVWQT